MSLIKIVLTMMINNILRAVRVHLHTGLFIATLVLVMASCMDNEDSSRPQPVPVAYVSIYNAAPDSPGLDIIVDNRRVNSYPFDYTDYSGYQNFFTGDRSIKFNAVNAANALVDTTFTFNEGKTYSIFVIDKLSSIEALVVKDSAAAPAAGKAMVRFIHLSPDAPALDVSLAGTQGLTFSGKSFRNASDFIEVDAKTQSFQIMQANGTDVLLKADNINLHPGGFYTIIVRGFANPPAGNKNILSVEVI